MEELISEKIEDERKNIRLQYQWLEKKIEEIETVRQTMKSELPVKLVNYHFQSVTVNLYLKSHQYRAIYLQ